MYGVERPVLAVLRPKRNDLKKITLADKITNMGDVTPWSILGNFGTLGHLDDVMNWACFGIDLPLTQC
jgi:hypothetical protein